MSRDWGAWLFGLTFAVLGTLFTFFPELLEHSPVGFEQRGIVHHLWHFVILIGGFAVLLGLWFCDRLFLAVGLVALALAIALNLAALLTTGDIRETSGVDIALRVVVIGGCVARVVSMRKADR